MKAQLSSELDVNHCNSTPIETRTLPSKYGRQMALVWWNARMVASSRNLRKPLLLRHLRFRTSFASAINSEGNLICLLFKRRGFIEKPDFGGRSFTASKARCGIFSLAMLARSSRAALSILLINCAVLACSSVCAAASADNSATRRPAYSESQIANAITTPVTPKQLLQNLKSAWDQGWLVQSSFYSDANLLKFFNATAVMWDQESAPGRAPEAGNGTVTVNTPLLPKMTVELIRGVLRESENGDGAALTGFVRIHVELVPEVTVGLVREVFGKESEDRLDFGISSDAHEHVPTTAGALIYDDREKHRGPAIFQENRASFGVKKTQPGMPVQGSKFLGNEPIETIVLFQAEQ